MTTAYLYNPDTKIIHTVFTGEQEAILEAAQIYTNEYGLSFTNDGTLKEDADTEYTEV